MSSIFSRLYTYRERPSVSPLENFLTEAFADLFDRLPLELKKSLVMKLLPIAKQKAFADEFAKIKHLQMTTQVSAILAVSTTRPDMAVYADERLILAIEAKITAGMQQHIVEKPMQDADDTFIRNQLETYAAWVAGSNRGSWPGAIVFLTGGTDAPDDFLQRQDHGVIRSVRTWREIGDWILDEIPSGNRSLAYCALASELYQFLKEQNLMTKYISSRDLAATMLFLPSSKALHTTFFEAIKAVAAHAPKLRGSRRMKAEFWPEGNGCWGWFHFAASVKRKTSKPYIAIGICFETEGLFLADAANLPLHEPFFFLFCSDDWETEKPSVFLEAIPHGWAEGGEDWWIISARPVRAFSPDPDVRVEELKTWATNQVDNLTSCISGYDVAPVEAAPAEDEEAA